MKKVLFLSKNTRVKSFCHKIFCIGLAFSFFFQINSTTVFAYFDKQQTEEEQQLLQQLDETLQEEYKKNKPDPAEEALKACLEKGYYVKCEEYVNIINKMFTDTRDKVESGKQAKEETFTPISAKEYKKQLKKNTEAEYKKQTESIETLFQRESRQIEYEYRGVLFNTPEYSNYLLALSELKKWQKDNIENLDSWKEEVLQSQDKYYKRYLKEFEKSVEAYKTDKEKVLNEYIQELANNLMQVYYKSSTATRRKMVDLFVMILSMESDNVKFLTSAQRSELYKFFNSLVTPYNSGNKRLNPCRFHTRARKDSELKDYNDYLEKRSEAEEARRSTLSIRDQTAIQARPYEEMIANTLRAPITELVDSEACHAAVSALDGLTFYKGGWDMSSVVVFMLQNLTEPMEAQILLMGTKTLIETGRVDQLSTFQIGLVSEEAKYAQEDDLKLKEEIFFNNRFYREPYKNARFSEEDGGGDAFRDMAEMLSKEKTFSAKNVQHQILDNSVYFNRGKLVFNNNLPLLYGILLHNPSVIDSFVPKTATTINSADSLGYYYNGQAVYSSYIDDYVELYIKSEENGIVSLPDNRILTYDDGSGYAVKDSGVLRKEMKERYKKNEETRKEEYNKFFANKKASVFFAEEFYNADFVDLTAEEKNAMDKALEKKYPSLKKISAGHKQKLVNNRRNLDITSGVLTIIDVALTLWCVADLYKIAKWGVKGIQGLRLLVKAGKTVKGLSTVRRIAFLRTLAAENKNVLTVHRRLKQIKSVPSRIVNKFPAYSKGIEMTRMSHDGQRVLQVTKLDGTPVMVGRNTKKGQYIESEFSKIMMGTRDYVGVPAGMQGQRLAVQYHNKYVVGGGTNTFWKKALKPVQASKAYGPIQIFEKDGKTPLEYKEIKLNEEGYFEVDGDFLKTFKANMEADDIAKYNALLEETIADLEKTLAASEERFAFLTANKDILTAEELLEYENLNNTSKLLAQLKEKRYVTLRHSKPSVSFVEKWRLHKKGYNVVPIYDVSGNQVARVSLDLALDNSKVLTKALDEGKTFLLKDNKLWLGEEVLDVKIGAPKEVIYMLTKAGRKVEDFSFLTLTKKRSKMFPLFFNNALSLSAGATSLNMSLNQAPFNNPNDPNYIPQPIIFGISVGFPYAFSLLSPMAAPFVKRFGVSNIQTTALLIGGAGLTYSAFNGYYGFATKKRDAMGRPLYDENGHTIPADNAPSYKPLVFASLAAGISSALTRASLNTAIHRFATSKASMTVSMIAKNIGSLSMTLIPWGAEAIFGKDNVDFSISYPVLAALALTGICLMKGFIPSSVGREIGYKIMPNKITKIPRLRDFGDAGKEIFKPFTLFASAKVMPYYLSYLAFGATESYALFKTYNTFTRDSVEFALKDKKTSKNTNKFLASLAVTLPSFFIRLFVKRKVDFSKGILNSILFTTAGIGGLMLPGENHSDLWNISVGTLSGVLLAFGTANMYQYLQKRLIADVENIKAKGVLPLARKFDGVGGLRTTAISFYSGAYIGSFIPYGYSFLAEEKVAQGATDFEANQSVLPLALGVYGAGTIPLFFTSKGQVVANKIKPFTPLISIPLGINAMRNLYNGYNSSMPLQMQPIMPRFYNRTYTPGININLLNSNLKIEPYNNFTLKPLPREVQNEEESKDKTQGN